MMDVNLMGVLRVTQAFLPLLRAGKERGRIVNISSDVSSNFIGRSKTDGGGASMLKG